MVTSLASHPAQLLQQAAQFIDRGESGMAEKALAPLLAIPRLAEHPDVLHVLGLIRIHQGRAEEGLDLLDRALKAVPNQPRVRLNQARVLAGLGRLEEALAALRAAIKLKQDFAEALQLMASLQHQAGQLVEAESTCRKLLRLNPADTAAKVTLSAVLGDCARLAEAETVLRRGLAEAPPRPVAAALHRNLATILGRGGNHASALEAIETAQKLEPSPALEAHRAELLQKMGRFDESVDAYRALLAKDPGNPSLHQSLNDLLYRLKRDEEYLKSYDRAPRSPALLLGKATMLMHDQRAAEALAVYEEMLARDAGDVHAIAGRASALVLLGRHTEATALFETLTAQRRDPSLMAAAAVARMHKGDPERAVELCEQGLAATPGDGTCLAMMGIAWRLLGDERDDWLNGYDRFVRVFDLEPPEGFSSMADFNAQLAAQLDDLHPRTREYLAQSLRRGTQTSDHLFGTGIDLVDRLQKRLAEAVARYVDDLPEDDSHPFLSRNTGEFGFSGSWSSRLTRDGFHVNHLHPDGWISSCYYVAVPDAVKDQEEKPGWIKFGEPSFDVGLKKAIRRAVQPAPGRLVLFPSHMWHGTIPFRDEAVRTTIAFDAVPR
jgi:tetratricopeptide (TPR) repeat protein